MESQTALNPLSQKNKLLEQLRSKETTMDEFMKECAYWALETLDDQFYERAPQMPSALVDFNRLSFREKKKIEDRFWTNPSTQAYLEEKDHRKNKNASNLYWMKKWLEYIPEGDVENRVKLKSKISEYEINN